jgi:hypothetical protein
LAAQAGFRCGGSFPLLKVCRTFPPCSGGHVRGEELFFVRDPVEPEAVAEQVRDAPIFLARPPREAAVQIAHPLREAALGDADEQVVVVRHQAVGVEPPPVLLDDAPELVDEDSEIDGLEEDRQLVAAARERVVVLAGDDLPRLPSHAANVEPPAFAPSFRRRGRRRLDPQSTRFQAFSTGPGVDGA